MRHTFPTALCFLSAATLGFSASAQAPQPPARSNIPNLINVDLRNVLNNLSVALHLDRTNVPLNVQLPVTLAANVCGVSVNVLAASVASGRGSCTATNASPQLAQVVQQQMAAGGSVGGGAQGGSTAATAGTNSGAPAMGGATGISADSSGMGAAPPAGTAQAQPRPAPVSQASGSGASSRAARAPARRHRHHRIHLPRL
jgi:hypothetical protein